jgi:hypothetical protein
MAKRKSKSEEPMGASAKRALQFVDHLAERDQIAFGMLVGYAIKKLADLEPESLSIMLVGALTKLAESDRSAYDGLGGQIVWNTLRESGFLEVLAELKQKATAGDAQGAVEAAERIGVWAKGIESLAAGGPVQALIDAQETVGTKKAYVN